MFNHKDEDKALIYLPAIAVSIPVTRNTSAVLAHLIRHNVGEFTVSLEDLREDGGTLVISSHIKIFPNWLDENYSDMELEEEIGDNAEEDTKAGYYKWPDLKSQAIRREKEKNGVLKYEEEDWDEYPPEDEDNMDMGF